MLGREGADDRTSGIIYVEVVQAVFLYGSETWVTTLHIGRAFGGSHQNVDRRLTVRKPRRGRYGRWLYPPLSEGMDEAGLRDVEAYIYRLQNTVSQFIATRPIIDLCLATERHPWSRVVNRWWDQEGLDSEGMKIEDQEC